MPRLLATARAGCREGETASHVPHVLENDPMNLPGWLQRRKPRPDLQVVLFTRQGCHLCDDAWALLSRARERYRFALEAKDVDTSAEWVAAYGDCVPVVTVNGKVRFRGTVNEVLLQRLLDATTRSD